MNMKLTTSIAAGLCFFTVLGCAPSRTDLFTGEKSDKPSSNIFQSIREKISGVGKRTGGKVSGNSTADTANGAGNHSVSGIRTVRGGGSSLISEIYSAGKCDAVSRGGFIWITDKVSLTDLLSPLGAAGSAGVTSQVNFTTQGALMVDFGATPTPAYKVKLVNNKLKLDGLKAIVQVDLVKPASSGKKQAQVVSHPCAIYVMPRVGYSTLEVQSELGDVYTSFVN